MPVFLLSVEESYSSVVRCFFLGGDYLVPERVVGVFVSAERISTRNIVIYIYV